MATINFRVLGKPVGRPRQRIGGKGKKCPFCGRQKIATYTPGKHPVVAFKKAIRLLAAHAVPKDWDKLACVGVGILAVYPGKSNPGDWLRGRTDNDNLEKAVYDAITEAAVIWHDDRQVACNWTVKRRALKDERPFVEVWIFTLDVGPTSMTSLLPKG